MKTIVSTTTRLRNESGWSELLGVILEQVFIFFGKTFLKGGKLSVPKITQPAFIIECYKFVRILINVIKLYKEDYKEFKLRYITNANNQYYEIDKYFENI